MKGVLVLFHVESNTGYAIGRLEPVFLEMAKRLCDGDSSRVHVSYPSMQKGRPTTLPDDFDRYVVIDPTDASPETIARAGQYIREHGIDTLFGFDQPVSRPLYRHLRRAGIEHFVSYWGAPMSSIFTPPKRWLKQLEVSLRRHGPDHYIFESQGMADTAVLGRGIPARKVSVVYLGVDSERFRPDEAQRDIVYDTFQIPRQRRVFFYSGHMEARKGVQVIMDAARHLAEHRREDDWHIVLLGNRNGEEQPYVRSLQGHPAAAHVTFGGYRDGIEQLHRGCFAGIIASTGWDSLTCSSMEMQSSGLPLLLSDLAGLREAIEPEQTGLLFRAGDGRALADSMTRLLQDEGFRRRLSVQARERILQRFTTQYQIDQLVSAVRSRAGEQPDRRHHAG